MFQAKIQTAIQAFIAWLLGFILSIFPFWVLILALCFFDRHVGIKAAIYRGDKLQKNGLRRTIDKIGIYTGWILVGGLMQWVFIGEIPIAISIPKIIAGLICFTEFDSIAFNISEYTGRDYRSLILKRIPFIGDQIAEKWTSDKTRFIKTGKKPEDAANTNPN